MLLNNQDSFLSVAISLSKDTEQMHGKRLEMDERVLQKNVTRSKFQIAISHEPNVLGGCPSHRLEYS